MFAAASEALDIAAAKWWKQLIMCSLTVFVYHF